MNAEFTTVGARVLLCWWDSQDWTSRSTWILSKGIRLFSKLMWFTKLINFIDFGLIFFIVYRLPRMCNNILWVYKWISTDTICVLLAIVLYTKKRTAVCRNWRRKSKYEKFVGIILEKLWTMQLSQLETIRISRNWYLYWQLWRPHLRNQNGRKTKLCSNFKVKRISMLK